MSRDNLPKLDDRLKLQPAKTKRNALTYMGARELSDQVAYEFGLMGNTMDELARFYNVDPDAISRHHQDAFNAGKLDMRIRPRRGVFQILEILEEKALDNLTATFEVLGEDEPVVIDYQLLDAHLKYSQMAQKYLPKELAVTVGENPLQKLTTEEIKAKIAEKMKTLKD